jgi:hypothetical protein
MLLGPYRTSNAKHIDMQVHAALPHPLAGVAVAPEAAGAHAHQHLEELSDEVR